MTSIKKVWDWFKRAEVYHKWNPSDADGWCNLTEEDNFDEESGKKQSAQEFWKENHGIHSEELAAPSGPLPGHMSDFAHPNFNPLNSHQGEPSPANPNVSVTPLSAPVPMGNAEINFLLPLSNIAASIIHGPIWNYKVHCDSPAQKTNFSVYVPSEALIKGSPHEAHVEAVTAPPPEPLPPPDLEAKRRFTFV